MCKCDGNSESSCKCDGSCCCGGSCSCKSSSDPRLLFCIVGKSASGKDSLCNALKERTGIKFVCSYTDRPIRCGEVDGVEHFFVSKEDMDKLFERDDILAKTQIGEYRYCATVESLGAETKLYIVDPNGIKYIRRNQNKLGIFPVVLYIDCADDIRFERARLRGDREDIIKKRFADEALQFDEFLAWLRGTDRDLFHFTYRSDDCSFEELYATVASDIHRVIGNYI